MTENGVKEITTYEHPGDYVVVPVPVRDRIMKRLNKAEQRVAELGRERDERKPVLEAARKQAGIAAELGRLAVSFASVDDPRWAPLEMALEEAIDKTNEAVRAYDAARAAAKEEE